MKYLNLKFISTGIKHVFSNKVLKGSKILFFLVNMLLFFLRIISLVLKKANNLFYKLPNKKFVIQNKIGKFHVNTNDDTIVHSSEYFEKEYHNWLKTKNPDIFLDIGANVGFYSILALNNYKYKKAYCFEPNPIIFKTLQANILENNLQNDITLFRKGISDKNSTLNFKINKFRTGLSSFSTDESEKFDKSHYKNLKVPVITLDSLIKKEKINPKKISFIKIDVEEYEYFALKGMEDTLSNCKKNTLFFIEILNTNKYKKEIFDILKSHNFSISKRKGRNYLFKKNE